MDKIIKKEKRKRKRNNKRIWKAKRMIKWKNK